MLDERGIESAEPSATDERWMREALLEAERAAQHDDVPVGCVVVDPDAGVLGRGHNHREVDADPTAHAELLALRDAARARASWRLDGCVVYVTLEPCPMCAGALVAARVARVVYGARDPKAGAVDTLFEIGRDTRLNHRFAVTSGVLEREAQDALRHFFASLRAADRPQGSVP
jgi:tRNA(adenine34) deaminase